MTGLEPATTRPPDVYANQLRYIPFSLRVQSYTLLPRKTNFLPFFFGKGAIYHYFFAKRYSALVLLPSKSIKGGTKNVPPFQYRYHKPIVLLSDNTVICLFEELDNASNLFTIWHLLFDLQDGIKETCFAMEHESVGIGDMSYHLVVSP